MSLIIMINCISIFISTITIILNIKIIISDIKSTDILPDGIDDDFDDDFDDGLQAISLPKGTIILPMKKH